MFDNTTHQDHRTCVKGGRLTEGNLPEFTDTIEQNTEGKITSYDLRVRYICPECMKKIDITD